MSEVKVALSGSRAAEAWRYGGLLAWLDARQWRTELPSRALANLGWPWLTGQEAVCWTVFGGIW
jgi:hypothetical protein